MTNTSAPSALVRVPSGIEGLDRVTRGGFYQGAVYLLWGEPGTGKTIFGNQMAFAHVAAGNRAIYVTLLAESNSRMLQHISALSFFDETVVPGSLAYISAYAAFMSGQLTELLKLIRREVHTRKATMLILDGMAVATNESNPREIKEFIAQLQAISEGYGCVSILLTNGAQSNYHPEHTMVDGLIALYRTQYDSRTIRELTILKFRGSDAVLGRHAFRISDAGVNVFPRFESLLDPLDVDDTPNGSRVSTGVSKLDEMLGGGFPSGSTTMLLGPSGCGKTSLGLHFACQANEQEPALIFSFYETAQRLEMKASNLGLPFRRLLDEGHLHVVWHPPTEQILDDLAATLLATVRAHGVRRLFVDGFDGLRQATPNDYRVLRVFSSVANQFHKLNVTTLYTSETRVLVGPEVRTPVDGVSMIAENLILMRYVELRSQLYRLISILKVRDGAFDSGLREFRISRFGIDLANTFDSAEAIMSGTAVLNSFDDREEDSE